MEIRPDKEYKKPGYAAKIAALAAAAAAALTGCTDGAAPKGSVPVPTSEELGVNLGNSADSNNEAPPETEAEPEFVTVGTVVVETELETMPEITTKAPETAPEKAEITSFQLEGGAPVETEQRTGLIAAAIEGGGKALQKLKDKIFGTDDAEVIELEGDVAMPIGENDDNDDNDDDSGDNDNDDTYNEASDGQEYIPPLMGIAPDTSYINGEEQ